MNSQENTVFEALVEAGFKPRSYSGRCMYGDHCVSVSLDDDTDLLKVGCALGPDFLHEPVQTDSMGRGIVVYWPQQKWQEAYNDDCDEDEY
jgi:hypothetical protein